MSGNAEITRYTDEWGEWEIPAPGVRLLVKPSQKWLDQEKETADTDPPKPLSVWDEMAAAYQEGVDNA